MGLENVCRLCRLTTSKPNELSSLFENDLAEKLHQSCSIIVKFDENLPSNVCPICRSTIEHAAYFKKRCQDTNDYFDEYLDKKKQSLASKQLVSHARSKMLSISSPKITSRCASPKTTKALPYHQEKVQQEGVRPMSPKVSKTIPLPYVKAPAETLVRQVSRQYTRKPKTQNETRPGPSRANIVLFENPSQSPLKIKEESRSVAEMLADDWSDESPSSPVAHRTKQYAVAIKIEKATPVKDILDCYRNEDEWEDEEQTLPTLKSEPFSYESNEEVQTPKKRIIGEEVVVENHCNILSVYNAAKATGSEERPYCSDNIGHNKKIKFHCTECNTGFTDETYLLAHNCGNLRYACYICKKIYKNEYALVKHIGEHQSKSEKTYNGGQEEFKENSDENVYSTGNYIRMESTHKRQKTMYFKDN